MVYSAAGGPLLKKLIKLHSYFIHTFALKELVHPVFQIKYLILCIDEYGLLKIDVPY